MPKVSMPDGAVVDVPDSTPIDKASAALAAWNSQRPQQIKVVDKLPLAARLVDEEGNPAGYTPPSWVPGIVPEWLMGKAGTSYVQSAKMRFGTSNPDRTQQEELTHTAGHEIAHVIWDNIPEDKRKAWRDLFGKNKTISDPWYGNRPDHAFADVYGEYVARPTQIQKTYPEVYKFMSDIAAGPEKK